MRVTHRTLIAFLLTASAALGGCGLGQEGWSTDHSYRYDMQMKSRSTVGSVETSSDFQLELSAQLEVTPLEVTEQGAELALSFSNVSFGASGEPKVKERFDRVARELSRVAIVRYRSGAMTEAQLGKNMEALTVGIVRNVASALQLPALPAEGERTVKEFDATGHYTAEYRPGKAEGSYEKRKLSYESLIMDAALQSSLYDRKVPPPKIAESRAELSIAHGRIAKLSYDERLQLELLENSQLTTTTSLSLETRGEQPARAIDRVELASSTETLLASAAYRTNTAQFNFDAIKIGGRGFDELLAMLSSLAERSETLQPYAVREEASVPPERAEQIKLWTAEQNRALTAMAALLRTEPELTERAVAAVRQKSPASRVLISALGTAGTEQAQRALLAMMQDATHLDDDRNSAGLALIRTKSPTDATVRALEGLLDDKHWHQHATLGLGTFARLFRDAGRMDEHKRLGELLVARLKAGSTPTSSQTDTLSGLSNSGYAGMVGALGPLLASKDARDRDPAVRALRLVKHPDVEPIALAKLGDEVALVRVSALEVAENLSASAALAAAVQQRALQDTDTKVRLRALQLLISWKDQLPQVRATIEQVASADPSESIRRVAQRAVATKG